jgi:hypothetical protein
VTEEQSAPCPAPAKENSGPAAEVPAAACTDTTATAPPRDTPSLRATRRGRDLAFLSVIALLLLAPLSCLPNLQTGRAEIGVPLVFGGDEPHYLVLLNSVLDDGDLDLTNNYVAAQRGGLQQGRGWRGAYINRHVSYWIGGERVLWHQLFREDGTLRPGTDPALAALPEYPAHNVGLALLLAPLTFPFRGSWLLEPAALTIAALAVIGAMVLFAGLLRTFTDSTRAVRLTVVALFLGTPIWAHARTLFAEPFLVLCVVGAFWAMLRPAPSYWAASAFLAAGTFLKPQMILLAGALLVIAATTRAWGAGLRLLALPALSIAVTLMLNHHMYGSPLRGPFPFLYGDLMQGAAGLLFSGSHGLLSTGPVLALAFLGFPRLLRDQPLRGTVLGTAFLTFFLLTAEWRLWEGGYGYGPRLLVPVIPLLGVAIVKALDSPLLDRRFVRWGTYALVGTSVLLNLVAATHYWYAWDANPWELLRKLPVVYEG